MSVEKRKIYTKAHALAVAIHKMSLALPSFEMREEGSQIRRSSKSVSAQIVEGFALRNYKNEYPHYLYRAYASCKETKEHLLFLFETKSLANKNLFEDYLLAIEELNKMIYSFIISVDRGHQSKK